ncbi:MAG: DUF3853 family protein [Bacteroidales bacterium]|nr:DUF3853 family protein [Bacteroidales bacterium]
MDIKNLAIGNLGIIDVDKLIIGLEAFHKKTVTEVVNEVAKNSKREEYLKGIEGIMEIFDCSKNLAQDIKNSGVIDDAIIPLGTRAFLVKKYHALELWEAHKKQVKMKRRRGRIR